MAKTKISSSNDLVFRWADQAKYRKSVGDFWIEFAGKRKLMDELLAEINNCDPRRCDAKNLARYAILTSRCEWHGGQRMSCERDRWNSIIMSRLSSKSQAKGRLWKRDAAQNEKRKCHQFNYLAPLRGKSTIKRKEKKLNLIEVQNFNDEFKQSSFLGYKLKHLLASWPVY